MFRTAITRQARLFSTSPIVRKSPVETVKDAAKKIDRTVSDAAVKGIETGGTLIFPVPISSPLAIYGCFSKHAYAGRIANTFTEEIVGSAKAKMPETSGQAKGQANEVAGEAKGKASELSGKASELTGEAKGKAQELKGEAKAKMS